VTAGIAFTRQDTTQSICASDRGHFSEVIFPMDVNSRMPVIEAKINGQGPYRFTLDTGFNGSLAISATLADQMSLAEIEEIKVGDPSGRKPRTVRLFRADSITIGSMNFNSIDIIESVLGDLINTDGLIGLSVFQELLVKFDYINKKIILCSGSLPINKSLVYTTEYGIPSIEISINHITLKVNIDSGSPAEISLPLNLAKSLPLSEEPKVVGHGRTLDGEFEVYSARLNGDVHVGEISITNPHLNFTSVFPVGNLGSRFLKNLIVIFDPTNHRVQFEKIDY